jgi:hypothetical protein
MQGKEEGITVPIIRLLTKPLQLNSFLVGPSSFSIPLELTVIVNRAAYSFPLDGKLNGPITIAACHGKSSWDSESASTVTLRDGTAPWIIW